MSDISIICSSQLPEIKSWLDNYPILKLLVPTFITGGIAMMAYNVALSQREIAANKYNLDLFNKRLDVYDDFLKAFNDEPTKNTEDQLRNIDDVLKIIKKCSFLFLGLSSDESDIKEKYSEYRECLEIILDMEKKRKKIKKLEENKIQLNEDNRDIEKLNKRPNGGLTGMSEYEVGKRKLNSELTNLQNKINEIYKENPRIAYIEIEENEKKIKLSRNIYDIRNKLDAKMVEQLKVSHLPYNPNFLDKILLKIRSHLP